MIILGLMKIVCFCRLALTVISILVISKKRLCLSVFISKRCSYFKWPWGDTIDRNTASRSLMCRGHSHMKRIIIFLSALLEWAEERRTNGAIFYWHLIWFLWSFGLNRWITHRYKDPRFVLPVWNYASADKKDDDWNISSACYLGLLLGSGIWAALLFRLRGSKPGDVCWKSRQRSKP